MAGQQSPHQLLTESIEYATRAIAEYDKWVGGVKPAHAKEQVRTLRDALLSMQNVLTLPELQAAIAEASGDEVEMRGLARRLFTFTHPIAVGTVRNSLSPVTPEKLFAALAIAAEGVETSRHGALVCLCLDAYYTPEALRVEAPARVTVWLGTGQVAASVPV